jgi:hypothetical protein
MQKVKQFNLETQAWEEKEAKPQTALSLLQAIYLDEAQPLPVRIAVRRRHCRMRTRSSPLLRSATCLPTASQPVDRAIARSGKGPVMIEAKVIEPPLPE